MTDAVREGVTGLEAGREMDALVAERVMGWTLGRRYANGNGEWQGHPHGGTLTWDQTPRYSTDIRAAWEVVEKMRADGYATIHVSCGADLKGNPVPGWYASFFADKDRPGGFARGATMAEAICRAALKTTPPPTRASLP